MISMIRSIFVVSFIAFSSSPVLAGIKIPFGEREVLTKVYDLPNTDEFKGEHGNFMDLATLHKEFNIAYFLPLWVTEEPKLVGYDEQADAYYDIPLDQMDVILVSQRLHKEDLIKLSFYTRYGGKIVALLIIGLMIWGVIPSKKEKVDPKNI